MSNRKDNLTDLVAGLSHEDNPIQNITNEGTRPANTLEQPNSPQRLGENQVIGMNGDIINLNISQQNIINK